ncbi:YSIRK-type signal peptide-containing protein, partial [Streptococcus sp. DD11]
MGKDLFNPHLRKFSIRKLNIGVCSVLLSTVFLLGTAATVSADESTSGSADDSISLPESGLNAAVSQPAAADTFAAAVSEAPAPEI